MEALSNIDPTNGCVESATFVDVHGVGVCSVETLQQWLHKDWRDRYLHC